MDAKVQIEVLLFSFLYGVFFYFISLVNNKIIFNKKRLYKSVTIILFMYNIVLLYIIIVYKINKGIFHIYFFLMMILGFMLGARLHKYLLNNVKYRGFVAKVKKRCYTKKK